MRSSVVAPLARIWDKATIRNGQPGDCKCETRYTCKPRCIIRTPEELMKCLLEHHHVDHKCEHFFAATETQKCRRCDVTKLEHRIDCGCL